jgi:hypothetical protein
MEPQYRVKLPEKDDRIPREAIAAESGSGCGGSSFARREGGQAWGAFTKRITWSD